jgi:release factor glutamine methyltransferase
MYFRKMEVKSNKIGDILNFYKGRLIPDYDEKEADSLLFMLIEEFAGISKALVLSEPERTISESELLKIHFAVKDLNSFKPIQYILAKTEFYGLKLEVNPCVLIPRPETEELVELIIRENQTRKNIRVIDVGTGSGCIAIAIKKKLPDITLVAVDISEQAIRTASKNAIQNNTTIEFKVVNFLDKGTWSGLEWFDIIVSNPPYVRVSEKEFMKKNVLNYEPEEALFVDDKNPLIYYKAIAEFACQNLMKSVKVYCEINQYLGKDVMTLFSEAGFEDVVIVKDLFGNDRFLKATFIL